MSSSNSPCSESPELVRPLEMPGINICDLFDDDSDPPATKRIRKVNNYYFIELYLILFTIHRIVLPKFTLMIYQFQAYSICQPLKEVHHHLQN